MVIKKIFFFILILSNFNSSLFASENDSNKRARTESGESEGERPAKRQKSAKELTEKINVENDTEMKKFLKKPVDYFVLSFQADNEKEEKELNDALSHHYFNRAKRQSARILIKNCKKIIEFCLG